MTNRRYDENGYLHIDGNPLTRVSVADYYGRELSSCLDGNQSYGVFKSPESLSSKETLDSCSGIPIIENHVWIGRKEDGYTPSEEIGVEGFVKRAYYEDGIVKGDIVIHSKRLIDIIDAGKCEISCGYTQELKRQDGIHDGQPYQFLQDKIRFNHVAVVNEGRMGHDVRVLDFIDRGSAIMAMDGKPEKVQTMTIKTEGLELETLSRSFDEKLEALKSDIFKRVEDIYELTKSLAEKENKEMKDKIDESVEKKSEDSAKRAEDFLRQSFDDLKSEFEKFKSEETKRIEDNATRVIDEQKKKLDLCNSVSSYVGTFDSSEMSFNDVCKYACDKMGLKYFSDSDAYSVIYNHMQSTSPVRAEVRATDGFKFSDDVNSKIDNIFSRR